MSLPGTTVLGRTVRHRGLGVNVMGTLTRWIHQPKFSLTGPDLLAFFLGDEWEESRFLDF